jgi:hypothetical protein
MQIRSEFTLVPKTTQRNYETTVKTFGQKNLAFDWRKYI